MSTFDQLLGKLAETVDSEHHSRAQPRNPSGRFVTPDSFDGRLSTFQKLIDTDGDGRPDAVAPPDPGQRPKTEIQDDSFIGNAMRAGMGRPPATGNAMQQMREPVGGWMGRSIPAALQDMQGVDERTRNKRPQFDLLGPQD
jgi:hypothetical protein